MIRAAFLRCSTPGPKQKNDVNITRDNGASDDMDQTLLVEATG